MRKLLAAALALMLAASSGWAGDKEDSSREYAVKAAFIRQFFKYVDWPEGTFQDPTDPIVVGVLGENPFGNALEQMTCRRRRGCEGVHRQVLPHPRGVGTVPCPFHLRLGGGRD